MACAWGCLLAWVVQEGWQGTHHDHERDVLQKKRMYKKLKYSDPLVAILLLLLGALFCFVMIIIVMIMIIIMIFFIIIIVIITQPLAGHFADRVSQPL